jgi:hypothetical protein
MKRGGVTSGVTLEGVECEENGNEVKELVT